MTEHYRSSGKKVLLDGLEIAQAITENHAELIAKVMNQHENPVPTVAAPTICQISKQQDEWFCATHGTRWDNLDRTPDSCV